MEFLTDARSHFSDKTFEKVKEKVLFLIEKENEFNPFYSALNIYKEPNNFTGYKKPSTEKITGLVGLYIQKCKPEFNDKLNRNWKQERS